jgi:hypothetical protein
MVNWRLTPPDGVGGADIDACGLMVTLYALLRQ